jgi:uncharacterized repeat protein (TIGR01451 family)
MSIQSSLRSLLAAAVLASAAVPASALAAPGPADLAVSVVPPPGLVGQTIQYEVRVANIGGSNANSVVFEDDLPASSMWMTATPDAGACAFGPFGPNADLRCWFGTLVPGDTRTIKIVIHPTAVSQVNVASATTTSPESSVANNSQTTNTNLPAVAISDLSVTLADGPDPVRVGQILTYTGVVTNIQDDTARDVVLSDLLPPNVRFVDAWSSIGRTCSHAPTPFGEAVYCKLGSINPGSSASVSIVVQPQSPGVLYNTVGASQSTVDPMRPTMWFNSATARSWVNL